MTRRFGLFTLVCLSLAALSGCGVLSSTPSTLAVRDATDGLSEAELAALLETRPQVPDDYRLAWLAVAPGHDDALEAQLSGLPGQRDAVRLSPLVAAGRRRFDDGAHAEVSLQRLRLLAARAHADVLVIVDHGWRSTRSPNGWAALSVLLLPALFTPHVEADVESYVEATLIDVRTGTILAETSVSDAFHVANMTLWSSDDQQRAEAQIETLLAQTHRGLAERLDASREASRATTTQRGVAMRTDAP